MVIIMSTMKKLFEDKNGQIVIGQKPNLPIIVWALTYLLQLVPALSPIDSFLSVVSFGALFTWAWLEIFDGANWFRRILGLVVMALILSSDISL